MRNKTNNTIHIQRVWNSESGIRIRCTLRHVGYADSFVLTLSLTIIANTRTVAYSQSKNSRNHDPLDHRDLLAGPATLSFFFQLFGDKIWTDSIEEDVPGASHLKKGG